MEYHGYPIFGRMHHVLVHDEHFSLFSVSLLSFSYRSYVFVLVPTEHTFSGSRTDWSYFGIPLVDSIIPVYRVAIGQGMLDILTFPEARLRCSICRLLSDADRFINDAEPPFEVIPISTAHTYHWGQYSPSISSHIVHGTLTYFEYYQDIIQLALRSPISFCF